MDRTETIKVFTDKLRNKEPFSFVKIGDDCVFCMQGWEGRNAEQHDYSPELAEHLRKAYVYLAQQPDVFMGEWEDNNYGTAITKELRYKYNLKPQYVFFDALLLHEDQYLTEDLKDFYKLLKEDTRQKYYIARERMRKAADIFNMNFVTLPFPNSYNYIKKVKNWVKEMPEGSIILLSCGMLAKVVVYECHKMNKGFTVIDLGSAFDPLFVGDTRSNEPNQYLKVRNYYAEIL